MSGFFIDSALDRSQAEISIATKREKHRFFAAKRRLGFLIKNKIIWFAGVVRASFYSFWEGFFVGMYAFFGCF